MTEKSHLDRSSYIKSINDVARFNSKYFLNSGFDFTNDDHVLPEDITNRLISISKRFDEDLDNVKHDLWEKVNKMREKQIEDQELEIESLNQNEYGEPLDDDLQDED